MQNIWQKLKSEGKPFSVLAPMEDVTDTVFRQIIIDCGRPDIFFSEFMSCEGFISKVGKENVIHRLKHIPNEKPLIAQIWGINPKSFYKTALELSNMDFDGVDINMGCPQKHIIKGGGCAALINTPELAVEIIKATQEGLKHKLPLSVKTRIGFNKENTENWIGLLLAQNLDALIVHCRTAKEMSKVPARWDEIRKSVELKNQINPDTIIIGNGDIQSVLEGENKAINTGADGFMVGRGIFQNPWMFNPQVKYSEITIKQKLELLLRHVNLYERTWQNTKPLRNLRHYYKIYLSGFENANKLRDELMQINNYDELKEHISKMIKHTIRVSK